MAQQWQFDSPKILDVADVGERVTRLKVAVVGGRVDVVTHGDSPTARIEVTEVQGGPVRVSWQAGTLKVSHGRDEGANLLEVLKRTLESFGRNMVRVSISVPPGTRTSITTVGAEVVISGLREKVRVSTLTGSLTVSDLDGALELNTVSGNVECDAVRGPLSINTVSGAVTAQACALPTVKVNTVSGDVALDLVNATAQIRSNSVSGDVTVRAPFEGYDVEVNGPSGLAVVDGQRLARDGAQGPGTGRRLSKGDGALRIKANAVSGNLVVLPAGGGDGGGTDPQDVPPGKHPDDRPAVG